MEKHLFPKWVYRILSHLSALTYGMYIYMAAHDHHSIDISRWIITGGFGIMFFVQSLPNKNENI